ncbi:MAG: FGGY family carbohydrate kinase [Nitrososphaeria archaeon]|nr:FGGY family carbohydrate kinase [Nitrososphaeria archaeon]
MSCSGQIALVYDCGSTNIRVAAVTTEGEIVAQRSAYNSPKPQSGGKPGWLIWDVGEIWSKLCKLTREVLRITDGRCLSSVIVTTFGADGVLIKRNGELAYPVISWQCSRTQEVVKELIERIDPYEIFKTTGYQILPFNTLIKWIWIRKNAPEAFKEAYTFLMMPAYISYKLTGELHVEPTDASTTMAVNSAKREWSPEMLDLAGLDESFFPDWKEPGEVAGYVTDEVSEKSGLKKGLPVIVGGHDTQFAIASAKASENEAILSSGTWEILALRMRSYFPSKEAFENGVLIELDVERGCWNPQFLMMASAVLEWIRNMLYQEVAEKPYDVMVSEAEKIQPGSEGLIFLPSFFPSSGPTARYNVPGAALGLGLKTNRAHIYRAALEGLSYQLRLAFELMEESFDTRLNRIWVVGGGSRNDLWNKIRADVLFREVLVTKFIEATVLGAAMVAFKGIELFKSLEEAKKSLDYEPKIYKPTKASTEIYEKIYRRYLDLYKKLSTIYSQQPSQFGV